jgi:zinc transport system substrate-binding protein
VGGEDHALSGITFQTDKSWPGIRLCISLLWLALTAVGCDRPGPTSQASDQGPKRHVLATVYPLADVVRRVAGTSVDLEWFCENGEDPRDLKLTEEQRKQAHAADMIVTSGFFDPWAGEALDLRQQALRIVRPDAMPAAAAAAAVTAAGGPEEARHGALWLDPPVVKEVADNLRERLTILEPRKERELRAGYEAFARDVDAIDADLRARLTPLKGKTFLCLRRTWGPLAERYGLEEVAPVNTEPRHLSDDDVRALKEAAKREHVDLLAVDAALLPGVQRELQLRTGLRLLLLDSVGSSAPDGHSTWIKLMRYNLEQLERGLK